MANLNIAVKIGATDAASTPLQNVTRSVRGLKQEAATTDGALKKANGSLEAMTGIMIGLAAPIAVFKKAFELGEEGAQIERTAKRFAALNATVGAFADDTLMRLQDATDGSVTRLALMGNANLLLSTGAASTQDELTNMVEGIVKLKKPTDDASTAIENFALLLANKSIPRLDSFGLSASDVRKRYDELKKTMGDDEAFRVAVFEQMDKALANVGEQADYTADAYIRLRTRIADATNELKVQLAEGLEPWVKFILGDYARAMEGITANNDDVAEAFHKSTRGIAVFTDANEIANARLLDFANTIAGQSGTFDEFIGTLQEAGISVDDLYLAMANSGDLSMISQTAEQFYKMGTHLQAMADAATEAAAADRVLNGVTAGLTETNDWYQYVLENVTASQDDAAASAWELDEMQRRMTASSESLGVAKEAEREHHEAIMEAIAASNAAYEEQAEKLRKNESALRGYFDAAINSEDAIFRWTQTAVIAGGLTDDQAASLEELQSEYNKLADDVRSYESGVKGVGLSEDERNEKIGETIERMNALAAAMEPLSGVQSEVVSSSAGFTINMEAANQAVYDSVAAAGASSAELALLGVALGVISEETANAALKTALFQQGLDAMAQAALADGVLTRDEIFNIQEDASALVETINNMPPLINLEFESNAHEAAAAADALTTAIMNVPQTRDITFNVSTVGGIPVPAEFGDAAGEKGGNVYGSSGVDFMVPAGYENDTFGPMYARSGERVTIETPAQMAQKNGSDSGRAPINVTINAYGMQATPEALAAQFLEKVTPRG